MRECIRSTHLLLLPGMMCDERLWRHQAAALSGSYDISVGNMTRDESVEAIAQRILAEAPPSFALAGLSMGAIVAMEMWRQQPQRIERLALLDTNIGADAPERRPIRDRQIAEVMSGGLEAVLRDELKPNYLAQCHRDNQALLEEVLAMGVDMGQQIFVRQSLALRDRADNRPVLATVNCPTLILCGDEDRLCPLELHSDMAKRIHGAVLRVIPQCGHLSTMEQPEQVTHALQHWLNPAEE
ncbi:MAG: alpha/beta hydrolase [Halioglobus sp.]